MGDAVAAYFSDLGESVSRRWSARGRRPTELSAVATSALLEMPPGPEVGAVAILEHALRSSDLPAKQSSLSDIFGQPPLVLFSASDFFVQALTWIDGTTDVHQHGFDGAFAVAEGASLHVPYRFDLAETSAEQHLVAGDLAMGVPEILRPGAVRSIEAGFGFIHALFHLEQPTVTIVVRNESSGLPHPQYTYLRPGLGFDKLWSDLRVGKRLQALGAIHRIDPEAARVATAELMTAAPPWVAFLALRDTIGRIGWSDQVADLAATLTGRVGGAGELRGPALRGEVRQGNVLARRGLLSQRHHRTFLALLANLPDSASVSTVLESLYPGCQPERLVLEWVLELASPQFRGISGLRLTDAQRAAVQERLAGDAPLADIDLRDILGDVAAGWEPPVILHGLLSA
jgi:predicted metal-dependent enzyme (double-stranded beta helix superfamily)